MVDHEVGGTTIETKESHMRHRNFSSGLVRTLAACVLAMGIPGCSVANQDSFTLITELPPGFSIKGEAQYVPRTGESCSVPKKTGRSHPGLKFFKQEFSKDAQTAQFEVPLTSMEGGCPLVLEGFDYEVNSKYSDDFRHVGRDYTGITFEEGIMGAATPPAPTTLQRQCEWLFRTAGPDRYIVKILKCTPIATPEQADGLAAKGALQRLQLAGKTLKVLFSLSTEERPYMGDTWIKFPEGWKRCMGSNLEDPYAFCRGNTTDFKPFKMPDGRDCTVYPNCTK